MKIKLLFCLFSVIAFVSCGEKKKTSRPDLAVQIIGDSVNLVKGTAASCGDKYTFSDTNSITSKWFMFPSLQIQWKNGADTVYFTGINVLIKSPSIAGGKFEQSINGEELEYLIGYDGASFNPTDSSGQSSATCAVPCVEVLSDKSSTKKNFKVGCGLVFGGLATVSAAQGFSAPGTVTIEGFVTAADGNSSNFKYEKSFTLKSEF